jgi:hypothetical protein
MSKVIRVPAPLWRRFAAIAGVPVARMTAAQLRETIERMLDEYERARRP